MIYMIEICGKLDKSYCQIHYKSIFSTHTHMYSFFSYLTLKMIKWADIVTSLFCF